MSSNIKIQRICQYCNNEFTAQTTRTKYCSHKCNSRHYKAKKRSNKVEVSNDEFKKKKPIENLSTKEVLSVQDAAAILGCSTKTIYRLINDNRLQAQNLGTRLTRISKVELNKLMVLPAPLLVVEKTKQEIFDINDCYTITEAQTKYNISQSGLRLLINRNKIPKIKKGKYTYVPQKILDDLLT